MKKLLCLLSLSILCFGCDDKATRREDDTYEYIPLNDYKYTQSDIKDQATVTILSFSGGEMCDEENTYYYQFIVLDSATTDTVRIFSACQGYDENTPRTCTFNKSGGNKIQDAMDKKLTEGKKQYLLFNKNYANLEKGNYKTAFGSIWHKPTDSIMQ